MKKEEFVLDKLSDLGSLYVKSNNVVCDRDNELDDELTMDFLSLYRVDEVTFEDKAPRKEALENVISSMNIEGINFVYIIKGDSEGVNFYYGVARDFLCHGEQRLSVSEIGEKILKPSLQGNFRGSVITEINANERKKILSSIDSLEECKILEGVPGINKDDEKFQSVDRVIDVMLGDTFTLMVIAKPITCSEINKIQNKMYNLYNSIAPIGKSSHQETAGESLGTSQSETTGSSESTGTSNSESEQKGTSKSTSHTDGQSSGTNKGTTYNTNGDRTSKGGSEGTHEDKNKSDSKSESENKSTSVTKGDSNSTSTSKSNTESKQSGTNTGSSTTFYLYN